MVMRMMKTIIIATIKTVTVRLYRITHENKVYAKPYKSALQTIISNHTRPFVNCAKPHKEIAEARTTTNGLAVCIFNIIIIPIVATKIEAISPAMPKELV